jgi:hypothetical protein
MKVSEAITLVREWVEIEGSQMPGFLGAHLLGSVNGLAKDEPFPRCRDLDIRVILEEAGNRGNQCLSYKGVLLDISFSGAENYILPELILTNPGLAPHMAAAMILADETGLLQDMHRAVAKEYARPRWVKERLEREKQLVQATLEKSEIQVLDLSFTLMYLGGLLAVADLEIPTHRRSLVLMRALLQKYGYLEMHEEALHLLGCAHMSREQVTAYLPQISEAFERAVAVYQTPIPYVGYKLQRFMRPYYVDASQEMIDEGHHREAMQWILHAFILTNTVLKHDAPEAEKPHFQARYDALVAELGLSQPEDWQACQQKLRVFTEQVFHLADEIMSRHPLISA